MQFIKRNAFLFLSIGLIFLFGISCLIFYIAGQKPYPVDPIVKQYGANFRAKIYETDRDMEDLILSGKAEDNAFVYVLGEERFENVDYGNIEIVKQNNGRDVKIVLVSDPELPYGTVIIRQYAAREIVNYRDISEKTLIPCELIPYEGGISVHASASPKFAYNHIALLRHPRAIRKFSGQKVDYFGHVSNESGIYAAVYYHPEPAERAQ